MASPLSATVSPEIAYERAFVRWMILGCTLLVALPFLVGCLLAPRGGTFIGFPYSTDDHMVYSAWMRQAMDGHFFFDNRFTLDPQPSLTVHVYFFALGLIAKLIGISNASNIARVALSALFLWLLYAYIRRFGGELFTRKLAFCLAIFGGGLGFLVWHDFGIDLVLPNTTWMSPLTAGKLPVDVWQPEGFIFPSLLANGLFAASLCLILTIFISVLQARESATWKPVAFGAVAMLLLMNIHSYDVLLVSLVLVGLLVTSAAASQLSFQWVGRTLLIGLGAVPAALWFLHVISLDPVFAARAATPTYSANVQAVILGYAPMLVFGFIALLKRPAASAELRKRRNIGTGVLGAVLAGLVAFSIAQPNDSGYFLSPPLWGSCFVVVLVGLYLAADERPEFNLLIAWAFVGFIAIYFPGLFQRKLAMGLAIPWAILAGFGLGGVLLSTPRAKRNFATVVGILLFSATSIQWFLREFRLIKNNVAETTVQPIYMPKEIDRVIAYLNQHASGRTVVLSIPGGATKRPTEDGTGSYLDAYIQPSLPDWGPVLTGFAGTYSYAGHWSETPDYGAKRRDLLTHLFLDTATEAERTQLLADTKADYVLTVTPDIAKQTPLADLERYGDVVVNGASFELIKLRK